MCLPMCGITGTYIFVYACLMSAMCRDLFARYKLSVPNTWEDMLQIARTMNGTDFDNDKVGIEAQRMI